MNKKELGAALRRGVVAGTIAGSIAGWASFAVHAAVMPAPQPDIVTPQLPPLPSAPALAPLPNVRAVQAPALIALPPLSITGAAPITKTHTS